MAASDLRASAALILAALAARGTSVIHAAHHLERGYERLDLKLAQLGARIERLSPGNNGRRRFQIAGKPIVSETTAAFADGDRGARESRSGLDRVGLCRSDAAGGLPVVSGPAADQQVHPALVRRGDGGLDDLHVVLSDRALWRLCLQPPPGRPPFAAQPGRGPLPAPAGSVAVLPIAPSSAWKPTDSSAPTLVILLLLTATVGLPYFVLSTTSPLIQAWFSRSFPGRTPYRLYALSNFGSFLALLSYPFVFEPAFDLTTQSRLWSWAFPVYAVLAALCGVAVWRLRLAESTLTRSVGEAVTCDPRLRFGLVSGSTVGGIQNACEAPQGSSTATGWLQRVLWLLLPACASLVLLATTNHVCQDVAVVPLLWVVPLSLYLLTFIICFDHLAVVRAAVVGWTGRAGDRGGDGRRQDARLDH